MQNNQLMQCSVTEVVYWALRFLKIFATIVQSSIVVCATARAQEIVDDIKSKTLQFSKRCPNKSIHNLLLDLHTDRPHR